MKCVIKFPILHQGVYHTSRVILKKLSIMKTLFLSLLLSSTFLMSEAKHHREKNQSSETKSVSQTITNETTSPITPTLKAGSGTGKSRTIRTGLIMMGSGLVGTIGGGVITGNGYSNQNSGAMVAGFGLMVGGLLTGLSGTVVTIVGLAMPRD